MTDIETATSMIVAARRARAQIPALSGDLAPASVEDAYAIQDASMRLLGPIGGWKLAIGTSLSCSPIPVGMIFQTSAKMSAGRPYKIEAEICIMIGKDLEEQQNADTIRGAIASVHPAIETVLSRFSAQASKEQGLADCQSNETVIVGSAIEAWANSSTSIALSIGGEKIAANFDRTSVEAMLPALAWLANHALARGLPLHKGQVVITGALLKGPAPLNPCNVAVEVDHRQAISLELA
jgi:2-keto-4-pentenoate hydratase